MVNVHVGGEKISISPNIEREKKGFFFLKRKIFHSRSTRKKSSRNGSIHRGIIIGGEQTESFGKAPSPFLERNGTSP